MRRNRSCIVISAVITVILNSVAATYIFTMRQAGSMQDSNTAKQISSAAQVKATAAPPVSSQAFDKKLFSIDSPDNTWTIANKLSPLAPKTYVPTVTAPTMVLRLAASSTEMQVSTLMITDLQRLNAAAKVAGYQLM